MKKFVCLVFVITLFSGCAVMKSLFEGVAPQDPQTVAAIMSLKAETEATLNLIGQTPVPRARIEALQSALNVQVAYECGKKKNTIAAQQWKMLADPNGHLLGGLLTRWKTGVPLSYEFIRIARKNIAKAFDDLAELEGAKRK